ncbi:hypothetical protein SUGI_0571470 [Cryptomeria japonica]|uniref:uncharacterized protein LOC131028018 n=1 Tax=Cryptomeria japonica TaxID=3369 RepID=UPI002408D4E5|nr:uncharacterized protein LOC131028018 [Cryptomeria japonica]GLJ28962.1 hypothetical protein SUGI_0571470 [Cryptomeria japonica]
MVDNMPPESAEEFSEVDSDEEDTFDEVPTFYYYNNEEGESQLYSEEISKALALEQGNKLERTHPSHSSDLPSIRIIKDEMPLHVAAFKLECFLGQRQMLSMLIEELCEEHCFSHILNKRAHPCTILHKYLNPYALRRSKLFEIFLDTLQREMNKYSNLVGQILNIISKRQIDATDVIQYVFHGTPPANLESILQTGMEPSCRRNHAQADFFGMNASVSIGYCCKENHVCKTAKPGVYTLLVFLVLLPGSNHNFNQRLGHLYLKNEDHELPIMQLDVEYPGNQAVPRLFI